MRTAARTRNRGSAAQESAPQMATCGGLPAWFSRARSVPEPDIHVEGTTFRDRANRVVTLRGVNLGGSSKMPTQPDGRTHNVEGLFESMHSLSFVGRPFSLSEADTHLRRLRAWGANVLRLIVTWEAIEWRGPGQYDNDFLRFTANIVDRAALYGMQVYVDPHQDVWSRFSGGDGAPAWTFECVGLNVRAFKRTGAALVHQTWASDGSSRAFPRMAWPTNMHKLACATMFTLFWAGDRFAPNLRVNGVPVQHFLQDHYMRALAQLASALKLCPNILGIGTMNEPLPGYLGIHRLDRLSGPLKNDLMPTPFEGMALAAGHTMEVGRYAIDSLKCLLAGRPLTLEMVNKGGESAWLPGRNCVWKQHGVWGEDARGRPRLLRPDYFRNCDFGKECYLPFATAFAAAIREAGNPRWLIFLEMPPHDLAVAKFPKMDLEALGGNIVHAPHWYDQLTLFLGRFVSWASIDVQSGSPALGASSVARMRARQLDKLLALTRTHIVGAPTLIGEVGIPFDMHDREIYATGSETGLENCTAALGATVDALEANNLSYTLWCYAPDHTPKWGDGWNKEDLSLYSSAAAREVPSSLDPADVHLGGRALRAFVRPYAKALAGIPVGTPSFALGTRVFTLSFRHDPAVHQPTLVFVPGPVQYPEGFLVDVSDGSFTLEQHVPEEGGHTVIHYYHTEDADVAVHTLTVAPRLARDPMEKSKA